MRREGIPCESGSSTKAFPSNPVYKIFRTEVVVKDRMWILFEDLFSVSTFSFNHGL